MKKRLFLVLLCLVFAFGALSGCRGLTKGFGGGKEENTNEISVLIDNKDKTFFEAMIKEFEEEHAPYTVNAIWTAGDDIQSTQAQKIATGTAPDVIVGGDMYTEVYRRNLYDLTELIERDAEEVAIDDIVPGIMENLKDSEGRTVFMPRFFNISLLYYNKALFDADKDALLKAGITPAPEGTPEDKLHYPHENWTIEDYFKAGGVLTKSKNDVYSQWGSSTVGGWWGEWLIHLRQAGSDFMNDEGYVTFNTDEAKAAMQIWFDKAYGNEELGRPKISVAPGQADLGGFQSGKTAMEYGGHTASWARFDQIEGLEWGVTVLPTGLERRDGAEFSIEGYGIYKESKNVEGAWEFIKFMTGTEGIQKGVDAGFLAIRESAYESIEDAEKKEKTALAMEAIDPNGKYGTYAMTLPKYEYFSELANGIAEKWISLIIANDSSRVSIDEACSRIEKECNDYIELNYK